MLGIPERDVFGKKRGKEKKERKGRRQLFFPAQECSSHFSSAPKECRKKELGGGQIGDTEMPLRRFAAAEKRGCFLLFLFQGLLCNLVLALI